ncbi:MAG: transporter substrate-binding domain-containing protein [Bacteroidales bacterium]|nr:transporter substrate-binding domain-containing protein [Bacteroidales bacterium]
MLQIGSDNAYFPFEYVDEDNQPQGFDIVLVKALASELGYATNISSGDWFIIKEKMEQGGFDMLAGMYYNPDRAELFDFSMPYIIITHSIFVKEGSKIGSLSELKEDPTIRVVVENSSILHKYLTANGILPDRILAVENQLDALSLVEDSYTTCALLPDLQAKFIAKRNGLHDIVTVGLPILPREYSFVVQKGDSALLTQINNGLMQLHRTGEYKAIFEKWFDTYNPTYSVLNERSSIFLVLSILLVVAALMTYFLLRVRWRKMVFENKNLNRELKENQQVLKDLHRSETLLKRMIEFSPFPIAMIHEEGHFVFTNGGFERLFGTPLVKKGAVNHWLNRTFEKEHERNFIKSQFFYNPKELVAQSDGTYEFSLTTLNKAELLMHLFFVSLGNGQLLIFFCQKPDSVNEVNKSEPTEEHIESAFSFSQFTHDAITPMNTVLGFSDIIKNEDLSIGEIRKYAGLIYNNANMLLQLMKNIGTAFQPQFDDTLLQPEFLNLKDILESVYTKFIEVYGSKIDEKKPFNLREKDLSSDKFVVHADKILLHQILTNLLVYALDLNSTGNIELGNELISENKLFIYVSFSARELENLDLKNKIEQINNAKDKKDVLSTGNDLNLIASAMLLKVIGAGNLLLKEEEKLQKIGFELASYTYNSSIKQPQLTPINRKPVSYNWLGKSILIVDDDKNSLDYYKSIFRSTQVQLIFTKDGLSAYDRIRQESDIQLVLMDWLMPVMNGETSTRLIKQFEPKIMVIAVTAFALADERAQILKSGCDAYFPKPIDAEELLFYINSIFDEP